MDIVNTSVLTSASATTSSAETQTVAIVLVQPVARAGVVRSQVGVVPSAAMGVRKKKNGSTMDVAEPPPAARAASHHHVALVRGKRRAEGGPSVLVPPTGTSAATAAASGAKGSHQPGSGVRLHHTHRTTMPAFNTVPGMPLGASGPRAATDNDRVGEHQPPPPGGFGGPCRLRSSNGSLGPTASTAARHLAAGTASPRPIAWSSVDNPRVSGLAPDSTAKVHPLRASTEARGRGEMPGKVNRNATGLQSAHTSANPNSAMATVAYAGSACGARDAHRRCGDPVPPVSRHDPPRTGRSRAIRVGAQPPARGKQVATERLVGGPATLLPRATSSKWPGVVVNDRIGAAPP